MMTTRRGIMLAGAVFGLCGIAAPAASYTELHSFSTLPAQMTNTDGSNPGAALIVAGSRLYGTAAAGGNLGYGTVF
ncbi:MAG TPA: hypothetical protein VHI52_16970, partial [Verrucomicrobiae bacterium]|nr:hypothetical protein [Verrucomicrobiae bacterium]